MVAIAADPLVMTAVLFTLEDPGAPGTDLQYECHVSAVTITPSQEVIEYATLCPDGSFTALGKESFQLDVVAIQDWSADGLCRFLWENAGAESTMEFQPRGGVALGADNPKWTAVVTLPRPPVGGEVNTFAEAELVFPVKGIPALVTA